LILTLNTVVILSPTSVTLPVPRAESRPSRKSHDACQIRHGRSL